MALQFDTLFKAFKENKTATILSLFTLAIIILFGLLYKNQIGEKQLLKDNWAKCESGNYQRDIKIEYLIASKAKSDSLLNRIMGRVEAMEELKKMQ